MKIRKRALKFVIFLLCLSFSMTSTASALNPISVMLDGRMLEFDVQPTIIDNRTMVPMRGIFEELGANVEWDGATRTVTATSSDLVVRTTVGNRVIDVNGNRITMDVAPVIVDGRTLVPARFVSEAFGADVEWDANTRTVLIASGALRTSAQTNDISRPEYIVPTEDPGTREDRPINWFFYQQQ